MEGGAGRNLWAPLLPEGRDGAAGPAGIFHLSATRFLVSRLRGLAGRLLETRPSPAQDAWVPRARQQRFPGELEGSQNLRL